MIYRLEHIRKEYKGHTVLDIDSLDIKRGKTYSLVGPNGAGKSTLLNMLACLDAPTSGVIFFNGEQVVAGDRSGEMARKKIVLVDQTPVMFSGPVWKNVGYGLALRKIKKARRMDMVREALAVVGMESFINRDARLLSGGETKRVALARALVLKPNVLLMDEPSANVDRVNQAILMELINSLRKESKTTIVFSTHSAEESKNNADQRLFLSNGRLQRLQESNTFEVTVVECDMTSALCQIKDCDIQVRCAINGRCVNGEKYLLRIDGRKIFFVTGTASLPEENVFSAELLSLSCKKENYACTIDMGVQLEAVMEHAYYRNKPVAVGIPQLVHIPQQAVSLTSL